MNPRRAGFAPMEAQKRTVAFELALPDPSVQLSTQKALLHYAPDGSHDHEGLRHAFRPDMTEDSSDVRDQTLTALKLTCPSADVLNMPSINEPIENPFPSNDTESPSARDSENEWSDEEELIPKTYRKSFEVGQKSGGRTAVLAVNGDDWAQSSQSSIEETTPNASVVPFLPPKSASRPNFKNGSSQDDLMERLYQVTRERDALRLQLQKSTLKNGTTRSEKKYNSDERTMMEELLALRHGIRNWADQYFSGPPKRQKRPALFTSRELFGHLTDNYSAYLKNPYDRPLLIQAYIWSKLQSRIFNSHLSGCGYVWAGKLGDRKLRPLNDALWRAVKNEDEAAEYHRWRAMTVNLLVPQVEGKWRPNFDPEPTLKWISKFAGRVRRKLRPWATKNLRLGKEELKTIVSAAVALDLKFKKQIADYRFVTFTGGKSHMQYGYQFYESEMENIDEDDTTPKRVELAVAPALERCGNANGFIYSQSFILMKADVSCRHATKNGRSSRAPRTESRQGCTSS